MAAEPVPPGVGTAAHRAAAPSPHRWQGESIHIITNPLPFCKRVWQIYGRFFARGSNRRPFSWGILGVGCCLRNSVFGIFMARYVDINRILSGGFYRFRNTFRVCFRFVYNLLLHRTHFDGIMGADKKTARIRGPMMRARPKRTEMSATHVPGPAPEDF